jgi:prepilin-type N-terminal cleavage/methylation domain-containing protein
MRRRGFTLTELIVVIGLVAFAGLVSVRIFRATLHVWKESASEQAAQSRFDQAVGQLRRDLWSATSIDSPDASALEIRTPGGIVHWKADQSAGLSRSGDRPADGRHWSGLGKLSFEAHGPVLVLRLAPTHEEAGGQMALMSQSMLLAGRSQ